MYDQLKTIKGFGLMGKYTLWFPLLFGLTIILMGCEERDRQPRIGTPNPSIHKLERLNASMRDSDLENAVRAKLENDPQLKSADLSVNADAVRNEVTRYQEPYAPMPQGKKR